MHSDSASSSHETVDARSSSLTVPDSPMPCVDGQQHAAPVESAGARIGPYKLLELIGEGGFGSVFLAEQEEPVRRRVALKIIKLGMDTRQVVARFEAERQALAMMDHPGIARVLDAGATEFGRPFFVMELVRGVPLTQYCNQQRLDIRSRVALFIQVCHAVQHAHTKGIIHRDIKPTNILVVRVDDKPTPKVIDFGIAKATGQTLTDKTIHTLHQQIIGTPQYMSPEQAAGSLDIDTRADVFSLGVVLYELLTGLTPYDARRSRDLSRLLLDADPVRPSTRVMTAHATSRKSRRPSSSPQGDASLNWAAGEAAGSHANLARVIADERSTDVASLCKSLRGDLDWITMKALDKDRSRRYETASAMAADLVRHMANEPVSAGPPGAGYRLKKFARRHRGTLVAAGGILAALVLGLAGAVYGLVQARHGRDAAEVARSREAEQRQRAEASGAKAEAINSFLLQVLGSAGLREAGRDVKVTDAIDRVSASVKGAFKDQPDVEAGIHGILTETYLSLGMLDEAESHMADEVELNLRLHGRESSEYAQSLHHRGSIKHARGENAGAESDFRAGWEIMRRTAGDEAVDTLALATDLANVLRLQERNSEAESIYRRTLEIYRRTKGNEFRRTLVTIDSLAVLLHGLGRLDEAEALYREAAETGERVYGADDPDTITAYVNLAEVLRSRKRSDEAERMLRDGIARIRRVFGPNHPTLAIPLKNLGNICSDRGKFKDAVPLFRESLELFRSVQGDHTLEVAEAKYSMALALDRMGSGAEAAVLQRDAFEAYRTRFGEEHKKTLDAMTALANRLSSADKDAEAEPLYRRAVELAPRVFGPDDRSTLIAYNSYGVFLQRKGRLAEAEGFYRKSVDIGERIFHGDDNDTLISTHNLMCVIREQGKLDEALRLGRRVVRSFRRVFGPGHPNTATAQSNLAEVYRRRGEYDRALELLQQVLETRRAALGDRHLAVTDAMIDIAQIHLETKQPEKAEPLLVEAASIRNDALPRGHWRLATMNSATGECLLQMKRYAEAEPLLRDAYETLNRERGETHTETRRTAERLARLYEAWQRPADATRWRDVHSRLCAATQPAASRPRE